MEGRAGRGQRWSSGCRLAVGVGASVRVRCEWEWGVECGNKNERYVSAVASFVLVQHCWQVGRTGRRNSLLWYVLWVHPARRSTARVSCPNGFDALSAAESPRPRFVPAEPFRLILLCAMRKEAAALTILTVQRNSRARWFAPSQQNSQGSSTGRGQVTCGNDLEPARNWRYGL